MKSAYSLRRPVANIYLVRDRDRRLRRDLLAVLAVALPLSAVVLAYVWVTTQVRDVGYDIRVLEQTLEVRLEGERRLKVEAARLGRHEGVGERASRELGLEEIELDAVIFVGELE